jgi:hypothetical protein
VITFDKLKLVADISAVREYDETRFEIIEKNGAVAAMKFYQETPFLLKIKLDFECGEAVIEFSGKVLGKDYMKLISVDTIRRCFENINALGVCVVDVDSMMNAEVVKCDVTKDVPVADIPGVTNYIRSHICSYQRFQCRKLRNGNLVIDKNVISSKTKKRMTIYNKENEMLRSSSRPFVEEHGLEDAFSGMCRFELNLNSKEQIRNSLRIEDTKLMTVLTADANPILDFLDDVVEPPGEIVQMTDKKTYMTMLVLSDCDYDLEKVEAKMRDFYPSKGTSIRRVMEPYRAMMEQMGDNYGQKKWEDVRQALA